MTLADLQSNISISAQNAVTGDIEWCSGYTQFSTDIGEQAGWYLALQVTPDVEDATVTAAYNGTIRELDNNIFIIRLAEGEDSITFTANKEGYTEGRLTLDLSGLNKETITNYCYVTSLTNGVTVTPLQFGESKTLSGVVPYDTTTNSNHFTLKYRTFIPIPAGSQISVSHFGTELGASTFNTVTPQEGDPYSEATVDITITQDILDSQSPGLSTLIIPDTGEVLDRFYCSLGVEDLTLAPDLRPKFSLTNNTTGVTFTPNGQMAGGTATFEITATGEVPYDTTTSSNLINITLTTNVSPDYDQTNDSILVAYVDSEETTHALYTGSLTWSDNVGTATFDCPITADSITYSPVIAIVVDGTNATRVSQILDTSALTLEPVPAPRFSITNTTQTATLTTDGVLNVDGVNAVLGGSLPVDETTTVTPGNVYPNRFNFTITTNNQGFFQAGDVIKISGGISQQPYNSGLKQDYPLTFNDGVGTANISLPIRPMNYNSYRNLWDANNSSTYFNIAIIRPGPDYPTTASDFTTIITRKVRYHHYLKFTPYRTTPPVQLSNITYEGTDYSSSDFVSGGTIEICSGVNEMGVIVKNMHFKWVNLQGTDNEYYLPLIATNIWMYLPFNATDTDGSMKGKLTGKFGSKSDVRPAYAVSGYDAGYSGAEPTLTPILVGINPTAINAGYESNQASCKQKTNSTGSPSNGSWYITFENCTFEAAPA